MKLAIVGYRNWNDYNVFQNIVKDYIDLHGKPDVIISGGCKGVDTMAARYAKEHDIKMEELWPDFKKYKGNKAFFERDKEIAKSCTHMLAFPSKSGKGTQLTIKEGEKFAKKITVFVVEDLKNMQNSS